MATKLFVGKLSYNTTNDTLRARFEEFGVVEDAMVIFDRETRRSKGFGFVEMKDQEAAQKAINELDGKDFEGQTIVVNVARLREENSSRSKAPLGNFPRRSY